jgi:hypothetical protein
MNGKIVKIPLLVVLKRLVAERKVSSVPGFDGGGERDGHMIA